MNPKLVVIAFAFVVLISVAYTLHLTNEIAIQGEQIILVNYYGFRFAQPVASLTVKPNS